jgi:ubiquinone/menaquinone biosynthesis C-methylase UbiE
VLQRILEPELMDDPNEAILYDSMDHRQVNHQFLLDFLPAGPTAGKFLDCGTGTALIPIEFCQNLQEITMIACDAAVHMLELAQKNFERAGLSGRIQCQKEDAKQLSFDAATFDAVISNSLLHHLAQPEKAIGEMVRVLRPGGRIFVRDLLRPASALEIESLVQLHAGSENEESQQLLRQSLAAGLSLDEIQTAVAHFGFSPESVQASSDRHWTWSAIRSE